MNNDNVKIPDLAEMIRKEKCNTDSPYTFICYNRNDSVSVYTDVLEFRKMGYNIWIDEGNLDGNRDDYREETLRAIESPNCKTVLFYLSKNSILSNPVFEELVHAKEDKVTIRNHDRFPIDIYIIEADEKIYDIIGTKEELTNSKDEKVAATSARFFDYMFPKGITKKTVIRNKNYKNRWNNEQQYYDFICKEKITERCKKPQIPTLQPDISLSEFLASLKKTALTVDVPNVEGTKEVILYLDDNKYSGTELEGARFTGTINGKRMKGKLCYLGGSVYEGELLSFQPHGEGKLVTDEYEVSGWFKNGIPNGKCIIKTKTYTFDGHMDDSGLVNGTIIYSDGFKYTGSFDGSKYDGEGYIDYPNGDKFKGLFKNGKREGVGTYTYANGDVLNGNYSADELNGNGKVIGANGYRYEGGFKNGLKHGEGREWQADDPNRIVYDVEYNQGSPVWAEYTDKEGHVIKSIFESGALVSKETDYGDGNVLVEDYTDKNLDHITYYYDGVLIQAEIENDEIKKCTETKDGKTRDVTSRTNRRINGFSKRTKVLLAALPLLIDVIISLAIIVKALLVGLDPASDDFVEGALAFAVIAMVVPIVSLAYEYRNASLKLLKFFSIIIAVCLFELGLPMLLAYSPYARIHHSIQFVMMYVFFIVPTILLAITVNKCWKLNRFNIPWLLSIIVFLLCAVLLGINSYKMYSVVWETPLTIGDKISLGSYEQDGDYINGNEPLSWTVIGVDDYNAIMICDTCIEARPYTLTDDNSWSNSDIREWLNDDFYNSAFTHNEMRIISDEDYVTQSLSVNTDSGEYYSVGSEITTDHVILPDSMILLTDIRDYISSYDVSEIALNSYLNNTDYDPDELVFWLREPIDTDCNRTVRFLNRGVENNLRYSTEYGLIRPVIRINLLLYSEYYDIIYPS